MKKKRNRSFSFPQCPYNHLDGCQSCRLKRLGCTKLIVNFLFLLFILVSYKFYLIIFSGFKAYRILNFHQTKNLKSNPKLLFI